ncbi:hypothetical protein [Rhizobium mesoamericanum]|uniref:hypothetical protein n=1 Tax=Rhizobium mesoamericanum TaxID=1079800 RepID=UPI0004159743|nr:hypothetical protein [Rhizobium mesoamericanum]
MKISIGELRQDAVKNIALRQDFTAKTTNLRTLAGATPIYFCCKILATMELSV